MGDPTSLIDVPVHRHTLFVADDVRRPLVPIRPICEALGIDFKVQHRKLVAHPTFEPTVVMVTTVAADQKHREMVCMPADLIMGWLMTIHPDRVAPKVRDTLIAFQRDASRLLHEAWLAQRVGLPRPVQAGRQPSLFDQAVRPADWLTLPSVQEAAMLINEGKLAADAARGERMMLRRRARKLGRQSGLTLADLDVLSRLAFFPEKPASDQPRLFDA